MSSAFRRAPHYMECGGTDPALARPRPDAGESKAAPACRQAGHAAASLKARRSSAAFALAVSFLAVSLSNPLFLLPFFFFRVGNRVLPSHLFALKGAWTSFGRRVAFTPRLRGMRRPRLRLPLLDPSKDLDTVRSASIPSSWPQPGGGQPPRRPWRDSVGSAPVGTTG
jgi:hypothetical protein